MLDERQFERLLTIFPNDIAPELKEAFGENTNLICLKKGDTVFEESDSMFKGYYIVSGSCVRYVISPSGDERAIMFHTEDFLQMLGNMHIKSDNSSVHYYIKANQNTEIFEFNMHEIQKYALYDKTYALFAIQKLVRIFAIQNQILNHLTGLSSEDFLKWFIKNYAFIFQRFSSKDIASFMNVTPTWFSLLKRKLS
ncbi:MAG: hypothetical protein LBR28_03620 [Bacteroidales bacterium]|jgi:hypothetical protein|nr:hypothetical protein [Bacteroidales bacterium]